VARPPAGPTVRAMPRPEVPQPPTPIPPLGFCVGHLLLVDEDDGGNPWVRAVVIYDGSTFCAECARTTAEVKMGPRPWGRPPIAE